MRSSHFPQLAEGLGTEFSGVWCISRSCATGHCRFIAVFFGLCSSKEDRYLLEMSLEIYLDLFSQPCRSVYIFAKKNNIQFDYKKISLFEGIAYNIVLSKTV